MRCILKLTGEAFSDIKTISKIAGEIADCYDQSFDLGIVIGGGNFFRGRNAQVKDKLVTDRAGMLGTIINGILLEHILKAKHKTAHLAALGIKGMIEQYSVKSAEKYFKEKQIVIFSGGTGLPYFTTDTATALRACELNCDLILKGTNVDGIYDKDPKKYRTAEFIKKVRYEQALKKDLKIMDRQAFQLLKERKIPVTVFNIFKTGNLKKALAGKEIGSRLC
jgi:uridylate kinase